MAIWVASRPDGAGRARVADGSRARIDLLPEPWLVKRLARATGSETIGRVALSALGGGQVAQPHSSQSQFSARCLVRLSTEGAEHSRGWQSLWSAEAKLQLSFHNHPLDAYSLRVADVWCCCQPFPVAFRFSPEQTKISARQVDDASLRCARRVALHAFSHLSFAVPRNFFSVWKHSSKFGKLFLISLRLVPQNKGRKLWSHCVGGRERVCEELFEDAHPDIAFLVDCALWVHITSARWASKYSMGRV